MSELALLSWADDVGERSSLWSKLCDEAECGVLWRKGADGKGWCVVNAGLWSMFGRVLWLWLD